MKSCLVLLCGGICACGGVCADAAADARRPYEMVWANREKDGHEPVLALTDAAGWSVETTDAVATFARATDRLLFGDGVCRLTYRATGPHPRVVLRPPRPVALKGPVDTVSCWIYGNNFSYAPDPKTPPVTVHAEFLDADGKPFGLHLDHVHYKEWFMAQRRFSPDQAARAKKGATLVALAVTGGTNKEDRSIDLNSLCVFEEKFAPLSFKPRAKRPNRVFPEQDPGINTGHGLLPFPNSPLGVTPRTAADARLEFRLPASASAWDGLEMRWAGSAWQRVARGGGVWFADPRNGVARRSATKTTVVTNSAAPLDVTLTDVLEGGTEVRTRFHQEGRSLVADVASESREVAEVRFGSWKCPTCPQRVTFPYYSYSNWGAANRPGVVVTELAGRPFFFAATLDWTQSNASEPYALDLLLDESLAANGGARYFVRTDRTRNVCRERFVFSFSDRVEDVLPNVPNPVSPWKHVTGTGVWRSHGAGNREHDKAYWRGIRARGMKHVIVTDHETCWRDGNESFTFRTRPAPKKGGDQGLFDYARVMIDELGFVYGPYNNFTDFAPVNGNWSPDRVSRAADLQLCTAWERCYAPKPAYAVEACAEFTPVIQGKFGFNTAYCDVHTAVAPWHRVDFDARVPGAGTFAATFYAFGEIMLLQKRNWQGPVYSEGGVHYLYCGLTDGNYAQDQSYNISRNPWLVDFDLLRLHPLCCNFGMGDVGMFYPGGCQPQDADVRVDRFLAATAAFGHPGYLVPGCEERSYFMLQALAAKYTQVEARDIRYVDADGTAHDTSSALARGVHLRSQVMVRYADGTFVAANGSGAEPMRVTADLWLPPNGYCGWSGDGSVFVFSGFRNGHRVDYAVSPEYVYMDGRGVKTSFPGGETDGRKILLRERDKAVWPRATVADFAAASAVQVGTPEKTSASSSREVPLPALRCPGLQFRGRAAQPVDGSTGAYVYTDVGVCGGVAKDGFRMHPPYQGGAGQVFLRFPIDLPEEPLVLSAEVGKIDGSDLGDGIFYRVEVIDSEDRTHVVSATSVQKHEWKSIQADLSPWKGRTVRLVLVTDCGPENNTSGDWAIWGDVKLLRKDVR